MRCSQDGGRAEGSPRMIRALGSCAAAQAVAVRVSLRRPPLRPPCGGIHPHSACTPLRSAGDALQDASRTPLRTRRRSRRRDGMSLRRSANRDSSLRLHASRYARSRCKGGRTPGGRPGRHPRNARTPAHIPNRHRYRHDPGGVTSASPEIAPAAREHRRTFFAVHLTPQTEISVQCEPLRSSEHRFAWMRQQRANPAQNAAV